MSWRKRPPEEMESSPQPSSTRRRTYDYSHQPEQGLQEWASRIKSIQAEVDKDGEAEQKRLEEEIVASRLARAQRRAKQGSRRLSDIAVAGPNPEPDQVKTPDSPRRNSNFGSARTTLMSPKADPTSDPPPESPTKPSFGSARTNVVNPSPGAPVSLAAFIGGRATGPRLTKPAPQADTHDPNQFDQTSRWGGGPSASANAVQAAGRTTKFGGSVALPGLGAVNKASAPSSPATESPSRGPRTLIPPQQPGTTAHTRQRTSSSPTKPSSPTPSSPPKAQTGLTRSNTVARARAKSNANSNPDSPPKGPQSSVTLSPAFSTPPRVPTKSHTTPTQGSSPTYGLARPIQPTPPPQDPNKLPMAQNASPAFRTTIHSSAKELSPSLTRLKGRGFVGNRVRQADGGSTPPSSLGISSSPFGEREKPKRGNVQERWQAAIQGQSSSPSPSSPVAGDGPAWKRRSLKEPIPFQPTGDVSNLNKAKGIIGSVTSHRSASPERMRDSMDEFGRRASPVLSGASPALSKASPVLSKASPVLTKAAAIGSTETGFDSAKSAIQPKPLNHLTRDRARKPKKGVQVKDIWKAPELPTTTPVGTPPHDHRPPSPFKRLRPAASQPSMRPPSPIKSPQLKDTSLPRPPPSPRTTANPLPASPVRKAAQVFSAGPRPESPTKESNVSRAKDLWAERAPIGVKPQRGHLTGPLFPSHTGPNLVGKRALPGMVTQSQQARPESPTRPSQVRPESPTRPSQVRPESPTKPSTPKPVSPVSPPRPVIPPSSPGRHVRTPSTGNRATVMELAQTMLQKQDDFPPVFTDEQSAAKARLSPGPPSPSPRAPSERRRSSYDRYSSIVMPPLKEEKTPVPTPAGTLSRSQELNVPPVETMPALPLPKSSPRMSPRPSPKVSPKALPGASPRPSPKIQPAALPVEPKPKPIDEIFRVDQTMAPIPPFNLQQVISSNPYNFTFPPNLKRISTDVFTVSGGQAMVVSTVPCVVYDTELIAVVQRVRNESSGLIANKVWGWYGRKAQLGAKDEAKLVELAKQYGTSVIPSVQGDESQELVDAIGGHWITRQGSRAHWTPENTTMQCTRRLGDVCFTDEVDFHVSNLCSAYSYTITALDAVYVWHGRGTTQGEREVAAAYGKSIVGPEKEIGQFDEGKEDPMFFMLLGEDPWANADYWKYRAPLNKFAYRPRMFSIDARNKKQPVSSHIPSEGKVTPDTVSVLDNILELFVIVGSEARARRTDILLGVHVAISIAAAVDSQRAFAPPVHLIVLPSQLPLDVRSGFFRFASDERVNSAGVPSHMNLLTLSEASEQLAEIQASEPRLFASGNPPKPTEMIPIGCTSPESLHDLATNFST